MLEKYLEETREINMKFLRLLGAEDKIKEFEMLLSIAYTKGETAQLKRIGETSKKLFKKTIE